MQTILFAIVLVAAVTKKVSLVDPHLYVFAKCAQILLVPILPEVLQSLVGVVRKACHNLGQKRIVDQDVAPATKGTNHVKIVVAECVETVQ